MLKIFKPKQSSSRDEDPDLKQPCLHSEQVRSVYVLLRNLFNYGMNWKKFTIFINIIYLFIYLFIHSLIYS